KSSKKAMMIVASVIGVVLVAALSLFADAAHECERTCEAGDTRTCYYTFNLQEYHTMSRACFNCPFNTTDCSRPECIAADGVARPLITINRQLPGPSIQVSSTQIPQKQFMTVFKHTNLILSDFYIF
ncbi:hypothetical protein OTU49_009505, partial [Cherax quadricarinatus]